MAGADVEHLANECSPDLGRLRVNVGDDRVLLHGVALVEKELRVPAVEAHAATAVHERELVDECEVLGGVRGAGSLSLRHSFEPREHAMELGEIRADRAPARALDLQAAEELRTARRERGKTREELRIWLDVCVGVFAQIGCRVRLLRIQDRVVPELRPRGQLRREQAAAPRLGPRDTRQSDRARIRDIRCRRERP